MILLNITFFISRSARLGRIGPATAFGSEVLLFIAYSQFHDERIPHYPDTGTYQRATLRNRRMPAGVVLATSAVAAGARASLWTRQLSNVATTVSNAE